MKFQKHEYYLVEPPDNYWVRKAEEGLREKLGLDTQFSEKVYFNTPEEALEWVRELYGVYVQLVRTPADYYIRPLPLNYSKSQEFEYRYAGEPQFLREPEVNTILVRAPVEHRTRSIRKGTKTVEVDGETYSRLIEERVVGEWLPGINEEMTFYLYRVVNYRPIPSNR